MVDAEVSLAPLEVNHEVRATAGAFLASDGRGTGHVRNVAGQAAIAQWGRFGQQVGAPEVFVGAPGSFTAFRGSTITQPPASPTLNGADRDRTDDLLVANQTLSQLSYGPRLAECPHNPDTRERMGCRAELTAESLPRKPVRSSAEQEGVGRRIRPPSGAIAPLGPGSLPDAVVLRQNMFFVLHSC